MINMTPVFCKAARAIANLTQKELAALAEVSTQTVADFERGARMPHRNNIKAIRSSLEGRGLTFIERNSEIVGIQLIAKD